MADERIKFSVKNSPYGFERSIAGGLALAGRSFELQNVRQADGDLGRVTCIPEDRELYEGILGLCRGLRKIYQSNPYSGFPEIDPRQTDYENDSPQAMIFVATHLCEGLDNGRFITPYRLYFGERNAFGSEEADSYFGVTFKALKRKIQREVGLTPRTLLQRLFTTGLYTSGYGRQIGLDLKRITSDLDPDGKGAEVVRRESLRPEFPTHPSPLRKLSTAESSILPEVWKYASRILLTEDEVHGIVRWGIVEPFFESHPLLADR